MVCVVLALCPAAILASISSTTHQIDCRTLPTTTMLKLCRSHKSALFYSGSV